MSNLNNQSSWIHADWPAPKNVKTLITTREGGVSVAPYDSLNLGLHVGDNEAAVIRNRAIVQEFVPVPIVYLNQIHSKDVVTAADCTRLMDADASVDRSGTVACAVMTADCLPVLFCDDKGTVVAASHAGWKGLANGVLEETVQQMEVQPEHVLAYFGPAIGPDAFEVGRDVVETFMNRYPAEQAFRPLGNDKFLMDIYEMAKIVLAQMGVARVYGGGFCTVHDRERFFSYRRDRVTGRMASIIWLDNEMI